MTEFLSRQQLNSPLPSLLVGRMGASLILPYGRDDDFLMRHSRDFHTLCKIRKIPSLLLLERFQRFDVRGGQQQQVRAALPYLAPLTLNVVDDWSRSHQGSEPTCTLHHTHLDTIQFTFHCRLVLSLLPISTLSKFTFELTPIVERCIAVLSTLIVRFYCAKDIFDCSVWSRDTTACAFVLSIRVSIWSDR